MPLHMRLPKLKGFTNRSAPSTRSSTWTARRRCSPQGGAVSVDDLVAAGAVRKDQLVKVLGAGDIAVAAPGQRAQVLRLAPRRRSPRPAAPPRSLRLRRRARRRATQPRPCRSPRIAAGDVPTGRVARRDARAGVQRPVRRSGRRARRADRALADPSRPVPLAISPTPAARRRTVLTAFARAFRTPDLRKKLLFTLGIIALFRLGVAASRRRACLRRNVHDLPRATSQTTRLYSAWSTCSAAARCCSCRSSRSASCRTSPQHHHPAARRGHPAAETLKKEGQAGAGQAHPVHPLPHDRAGDPAVAPASSRWPAPARPVPGCASSNQIIPNTVDASRSSLMVITMTAGTARDHVAGRADHRPRHRQRHVAADLHLDRRPLPEPARTIHQANGRRSSFIDRDRWSASLVVALVVFIEQAQRRIPVQYAKRMVGRRMYGGTSTYIPLKVNQAGVIPVIFASSLLYLPPLVAQLSATATRRLGRSGSQNYLDHGRPPALHGHLLRC